MKNSFIICILLTIFFVSIIKANSPVEAILKAADEAVADMKEKGEEAMNNAAKAVEDGNKAAEKAVEEAKEKIEAVDINKTKESVA